MGRIVLALILLQIITVTLCQQINLGFLKQKGSKQKQDALFEELVKLAKVFNDNLPKSASKSQNAVWEFLDGYRAITKGQFFPNDKKQMKDIVGLGKKLASD